MSESTHEKPPFPWDVGVFDAHCHPTDTMASTSDIPHMKTAALTIMATRGEDQELVDEVARRLGGYRHLEPSSSSSDNNAHGKIVPCFGWHPWFAHQISIQEEGEEQQEEEQEIKTKPETTEEASTASSSSSKKILHYQKLLTGSTASSSANDQIAFFKTLPTPKPLSLLLSETRTRLLSHPNALVGEIGLDRAFRLPLPWQAQEIEARNAELTPGSREGRKLSPYKVSIAHQRALFKAQLQLAGRLRRAVSVHSVQAHGLVFEVLQELWKGYERKKPESKRQRKTRDFERKNEVFEAGDADDAEIDLDYKKEQQEGEGEGEESHLPYPPRICMHSYSGPPEALVQFLRPSVPSDVYFSFSTVINFTGPTVDKVLAALQALPDDRILVESDLHCAGQQMDDLLEDAVRSICSTRGWSLEDGTRKLAENWKRFVFG